MHCTNCAATIAKKAEICPECKVRIFTIHNYCHNCGNDTQTIQEMCTSCGIILKKLGTSSMSLHPMVPTLLIFILPGVGQIINKQVGKGFLCLIIFIISVWFIDYTFGFSLLLAYLIIAIDAYLIGKKRFDRKIVGNWEFFNF